MRAEEVPSSALRAWPRRSGPRAVFEHRYYPTVVEEELELPTGASVTWLRYADERDGVPRRDGVMGLCIRDGSVLLARQYNPGADRVVWEFPGGGTNDGEAYEDALRRELMEEVDLRPGAVAYLGRFLLKNRRTGWGIRTYIATDLQEDRSLASDEAEHIESYWIDFEDVDEMIVRGEIDNATVLSGWLLFRLASR